MRKKHEQVSILQPQPGTLRMLLVTPGLQCPVLPAPKLRRSRNRCAHVAAMRELEVKCFAPRWLLDQLS